MDSVPPAERIEPADLPETIDERRRRLAIEADGIARARNSIVAGRVVDENAVDAWIDSIGTDRELPVPASHR